MNISDLAERMRAEMLAGPDPELAARAAKERRWTNSRVYEVNIARNKELIATIAKNNAALTDLGGPVIDIEVVDPLDLNSRTWDDRIAALGRVIWQQTDALDCLRASAAGTERERMLANETPIQRLEREAAERHAEVLMRIDQIAARSDTPPPRERYVPPPRPMPVMSGCGVPMGDGLSPGCALPTSPGVVVGAAARRVGSAGRTDNLPAMTYVHLERHGHGDSPAQFLQAIQAVAARR